MKPKSFSTPSERSNFYKELFSLAVPIGLQNLLVALIGASDALMLGRLTQDAVAAVSLANQIAFVMNLFIGAVVGGGGVLIAQYWEPDKGRKRLLKCIFLVFLFKVSCFAGFSACGGSHKRHLPLRRSAIPAERFSFMESNFP